MEKLTEKKNALSQKSDSILHIFDQIKVSRVSNSILRLQSKDTKRNLRKRNKCKSISELCKRRSVVGWEDADDPGEGSPGQYPHPTQPSTDKQYWEEEENCC